jgi:hypothetical protein
MMVMSHGDRNEHHRLAEVNHGVHHPAIAAMLHLLPFLTVRRGTRLSVRRRWNSPHLRSRPHRQKPRAH